MSTVIPLIPPEETFGQIDILLSRWRDNSRFRGFVKMIRDCDFVVNMPRFILESMKWKGGDLWRSAASGKLMPIDVATVLVSCISDMLNDRDLSSLTESNALVSTKTRDDPHTNMKVDSHESVSTPSEQMRATPTAANVHCSVAEAWTGKSQADTKADNCGTINDPDPFDRTSCLATRDTNAKRRHQRRNSIILPPHRPQNANSSVTVTVNVIPTDDPTIQEVHRIVLANAIALKNQEELQELRDAGTISCHPLFFDDKDVTPSVPNSGIFKDDSLHDPVHLPWGTVATCDLQPPRRMSLPSSPNLNFKISQSKRLNCNIQPHMRFSLQDEVGEGASIKRPFLHFDQSMPPRALVSVVSPCNETTDLELVDLDEASIQIDSTFFSETESFAPDSKTLQAKPSGRHPLQLGMRKDSRVVNKKRETLECDDIDRNSDQKESMQTEGKRVKRWNQSYEDATSCSEESLNKSGSQSAVTVRFENKDAS